MPFWPVIMIIGIAPSSAYAAPVEKFSAPRPERCDADAGLAGEPAAGRRHEGRSLLMPGDDELDRRFADGFDDVEVFLAGNSEDSINTLVLKGGDEKIRTFDHARSPKPERRTHAAWR